MRKVVFDPASHIAAIDWFYLSDGANLSTAVATHVARTVRRFKRGQWFVHVNPDQQSGHLFFRGTANTLRFKVVPDAK